MQEETARKAQQSLERTINLFRRLEVESCEAAAADELAGHANAHITKALGHLIMAKSEGTFGLCESSTVSPQFGGK